MAAVLEAGLPGLGIDCDNDLVSYLLDLLEGEGVDVCAEWLESAATVPDTGAARKLAEAAFSSLNAGGSVVSTSVTAVGDPLEGLDLALTSAKASSEVSHTNSLNSNLWQHNGELDKDVRREIVQRYACIELQTVHLGEDGQVCSSGVALRDLEEDVVIPVNDNAARVRQEQQERRLSQKQQHLEAQAKQQQQKLKQQQREEKERLRCQKKERQK
ncbi:uncharacterized protein BXIN_2779 [Babesia sp. Xinjiang]|uniref:uncharacterized protein n=1 Tax=Babesia sp. Xinjiang TaxID=462227 RepID=UPI000A21C6CB|nr:uncharacterized protein BXIN_2779 [Babesia sp. Xinjiang]ORM41725.1 hypothetical protein BXIN_2779 [Babesia sp. Xinjiang]